MGILAGGFDQNHKMVSHWTLLKTTPTDFSVVQEKIFDLKFTNSQVHRLSDNEFLLVGGVDKLGDELGIVKFTVGDDFSVTIKKRWSLQQNFSDFMIVNCQSAMIPHQRKRTLAIFGGGCNCFSFGTYLNPYSLAIDVEHYA